MSKYKDGDVFWLRCELRAEGEDLQESGELFNPSTEQGVHNWCDQREFEEYFLGDISRGLVIPTTKSLEKKAKSGEVNSLKEKVKAQEDILKSLKIQIKGLEV